MSVEQLALLGIAVFAFMAVVNMFQSVRYIRNSSQYKHERVRRLVGGKESANAIAESVIKNILSDNYEEVMLSRKQGKATSVLEEKLEKARAYYIGRVEPMHKSLFNDVCERIIFERKL